MSGRVFENNQISPKEERGRRSFPYRGRPDAVGDNCRKTVKNGIVISLVLLSLQRRTPLCTTHFRVRGEPQSTARDKGTGGESNYNARIASDARERDCLQMDPEVLSNSD